MRSATWPGTRPEHRVIEDFQIHVDDAVLDDLHRRLARTRLPDQIEDTGWDYGIPVDYLGELVAYWRDTYDWRAQEARLNELAHFRTGHRRAVDPLRPRPLAAPDRPTPAPHARLARFVRRVPRRHSPAHRPGGARWPRYRLVPRGRAVVAGLRLLGTDAHTAAGTRGASRARSPS